MVLVPRPRVLFLDAMGTLFDLQRSVGEIYTEIASQHKIEADANVLDRQFRDVFKRHHAPVFASDKTPNVRTTLEKAWWRKVVLKTFQQTVDSLNIQSFDAFFDALYCYFSTEHPWSLFPEVIPTLDKWASQGIELGIISNFDSRLIQVLEALHLRDYFQSVTISSQAGAAKPDSRIFQSALEKHGCASALALHVGDQERDDYQGALSAQLNSIWLNRRARASQQMKCVNSLDEIFWED
ncbi:MAG: HAD-IA family hydrolase [Cyanobacteria bacterium P01_F01_bin.42]